MSGVFVLAVMVIGAATVVLVISRFRVDADDVRWIADADQVPADDADVYRRYLTRHRRHRTIGGVFGVLLAVVVGIRWSDGVQIGIGGRSPFADVLFCGVTGTLAGALSAETYRLRRTPTSATASLAPREPLPGGRRARLAEVVTAAAVVAGVAGWAFGGFVAPFAMSCAGVLFVCVARATRRAIDRRARPVLEPRAAMVDRRIRCFAAGATSWLELAGAVLAAAWVEALFPWAPGELELVRTVVSVGGLVAALLLLRQARPRPPRAWGAGDTLGVAR